MRLISKFKAQTKSTKRRWPKPNTERLIFLALILIIQLIVIFALWFNLVQYSAVLEIIGLIISLVMVLYLITKDMNPAYRQSWIILIMVFPLFGGVLYFLIGNKRPIKSMRNQLESQEALHKDEVKQVPDVNHLLEVKDKPLSTLSHYLQQVAKAPLYTNVKARYYPNGESMMNDLIYDLKNAKESIFIEFFIVEYGVMFDAVFDVLVEKAKEGLDVRFMYDGFGTITRLPPDFVEYCESLGIQALCFNPVKPVVTMAYNTRDHRKFIIIDNEVAYTGGMNLADEYINVIERYGYWKDTMIRVEGASTWNYTIMFLNMWNAFKHTDTSYEKFRPQSLLTLIEKEESSINNVELQEGFVQPFGDSPLDEEPVGESVYQTILNQATDYVYIYTPYLVISNEMQVALQMAAKRGVDVRLMTPGVPDKKIVYRMTRSFYKPLLKAGVRIYEYSPGFLHAKSFVSDDKVATVGTSNLDYRSLYLHFETNTVLYFHSAIQDIKEDMLISQGKSKEITLEDTTKTFIGNAWDSVLRLIAPFV